MPREQYSRANQRKQTTNYYLTYDSIITFYKNAPRFLCALLECSYGGGQNRVFAQDAEVTDVLTAEDFKLGGYNNYSFTSSNGVTYCLYQAMKSTDGIIQINGKKNSYFAVTNAPVGYMVKSVTVDFRESTKTNILVHGDNSAYAAENATHQGTELKQGLNFDDKSYTFETEYPYFALYTKGKNAVYIKSITVVWNTTGGGGSVETVAAPEINPASQKFSKAFDATITGAEGTTLKYTLDGTDPANSQTATVVKAATATVNIPAQTTTLKAIALKGDLVSQVAEAVYTYRAPSENDGTFAKPYTVEEFVELVELVKPQPTQDVWVKGTILGFMENGGYNPNPSSNENTNVCIGTTDGRVYMGVKLEKGSIFRELGLNKKVGTELMVKGKYTEDYFLKPGMKNEPTYLYIADPTQALASINVKTTEGYATYYNDKLGVTIPEGIDAKCGVITDVNNGALTIDYRYAAGAEIHAGNAVLVKAGKAMQIPLIVSKHTSNVIAENMLKGQATTGDFIADPDYKYYKLAYNNYSTKEGLGFYFGVENGGAFTVPAGMAYLAVPRSMAVKCFLLDGSATGIEGIEAGQTAEAVKTVYTLDGRKVEAQKLPKGIYIVNGKKVIVK